MLQDPYQPMMIRALPVQGPSYPQSFSPYKHTRTSNEIPEQRDRGLEGWASALPIGATTAGGRRRTASPLRDDAFEPGEFTIFDARYSPFKLVQENFAPLLCPLFFHSLSLFHNHPGNITLLLRRRPCRQPSRAYVALRRRWLWPHGFLF